MLEKLLEEKQEKPQKLERRNPQRFYEYPQKEN